MSDPGFLADVMVNGPEEAKQLLQRLAMYTHVGYSREVGYVHSARLYGHADYRGKRHALNGLANIHSGAPYKALCGTIVSADHDGEAFNVWPAENQEGHGVSCRRCRRIITAETPRSVGFGKRK